MDNYMEKYLRFKGIRKIQQTLMNVYEIAQNIWSIIDVYVTMDHPDGS